MQKAAWNLLKGTMRLSFFNERQELIDTFFSPAPPQTNRQNHCDIIGQRLAEDNAV